MLDFLYYITNQWIVNAEKTAYRFDTVRRYDFHYWLAISFRASLREKFARPFSSKPMNLTQV